jgi:uncharacterized protein YheU (UPF0270 family)
MHRAMTDRDDDTRPDIEGLPPRVLVPWDKLSPEALQSVMEEYVTREGTEYGEVEVSLADKVRDVRRQLERGDVVVVFDLALQTANLLTAREAKAANIE